MISLFFSPEFELPCLPSSFLTQCSQCSGLTLLLVFLPLIEEHFVHLRANTLRPMPISFKSMFVPSKALGESVIVAWKHLSRPDASESRALFIYTWWRCGWVGFVCVCVAIATRFLLPAGNSDFISAWHSWNTLLTPPRQLRRHGSDAEAG